MNQRSQYENRGSRQARRPEEDRDANRARSGRSFDDDTQRHVGSRDDFDEMSQYDAGERGRQYASEQDDGQYLGGYPSARGPQYYDAPRQPVQYGQPHDPPGRDAEPFDHPRGGQRQFSTGQPSQRYPQYGELRSGGSYGGAYGPEDFRQGSGVRNWASEPRQPQRNFARQGGRSAGNHDFDRGYGSYRQSPYQSGYGASQGGYAHDYDEGDYDQAFGGYSPSQRGYGDSWSGYGRGGYGPNYGQEFDQDLMGTSNSTIGSGGFSQGPGNFERQGYGQGSYAGRPGYGSQQGSYGANYSQGLSGRGGTAQGGRFDYGASRAPSHFGKGPKGYVRSDERLKEDISERLMRDHAIDASDISIDAKGGNVTLSGSVEDRRLKHYVEDMVEQCSGVKDIDNRLTVRQRGQEAPTTPVGARTANTTSATASSSGTTAGSGSLGGSTGEDGNATRKN